MSTAAADPSTRSRASRVFAYISFAIMIGGWVAFFGVLLVSQTTLDEVWSTIGGLPLVVEAIAWVLGFPFLVGLAIWQASWDEAVRVIAIAVLAVAYAYMFLPRGRTR